jgi:methylenetetrahydrofolate reductase (NADPH)
MTFQEKLQQRGFLITSEVTPPKGTDISEVIGEVESLKGRVDALTVTDGKNSVMTMTPLVLGHLLQRKGFEPILYVSCRDRNRMALQAELLGAAALGIGTLVVTTGDYASMGDHPQTKPVFDLDSIQLLKVIQKLANGQDMMGNPLRGGVNFFVGATLSPVPGTEAAWELQLVKMEKKVAAGAKFFQTQPIFDLRSFERFMKRAGGLGVPILASVLPIKSASMARFINKNMPGIVIPEPMIEEMGSAPDRVRASIQICARLIQELRGLCQGIHLIPVGWERKVPAILEAVKL